MTTILRLKKRQVGDLMKCAKKVEKAAKKLSEFIEDELFDDEEMDERRGVPGTGRYGRRSYRRRRY